MKKWKLKIYTVEDIDMKRRIRILNDRNSELSENLISFTGFVLG
jgi:hypothetical protein